VTRLAIEPRPKCREKLPGILASFGWTAQNFPGIRVDRKYFQA
jgi:hypothetical protein